MNEHYKAYINFGRHIANERGVTWEMSLNPDGTVVKKDAWNMTKLVGDSPPPTHWVRDFGKDIKAIEALNSRGAGSRYFCESFFGHPCPTSGKNYATANAFGGPSRPASLVACPTRGMQHHSRNDSTRCRKACIFTTQKDAS